MTQRRPWGLVALPLFGAALGVVISAQPTFEAVRAGSTAPPSEQWLLLFKHALAMLQKGEQLTIVYLTIGALAGMSAMLAIIRANAKG